MPELVAAGGERASMRFLNSSRLASATRTPGRAYARAADEFLAWCAAAGLPSIGVVQPVHGATWIEAGTRELAVPSVKQGLASVRYHFDGLVTGQVVPVNPAASVRGPRHVVTSGQTPALDPSEARALPKDRHLDRRRSARPRINWAHGLQLRQDRRGAWHVGRGCRYAKLPAMGAAAREGRQAARDAVPSNIEEYLIAYLDGVGLRGDPKGPLFRTIGRGTNRLTRTVLPQANAYAMIRRRAAAVGIATKLGNHSFRATGITPYLKNGGTLEKAAAMANHASTRTTQLYDRPRDEFRLDEVSNEL